MTKHIFPNPELKEALINVALSHNLCLEELAHELNLIVVYEKLQTDSMASSELPTLQPVGPTLKTIYPEWETLRKREISLNTWSKDIKFWTTYIEPNEISNIPLSRLTRADLDTWANEITSLHPMTKKYYNNIKSTFNSLLNFAVKKELLETNRLKDVKVNRNKFVPKAPKEEFEEVFSREERKLIYQKARNDSLSKNSAIPLGIILLFNTGIRVGELCALTYGSIEGNDLVIDKMLIRKNRETENGPKCNGYEIVFHTKSPAGNRRVPLTKEALDCLDLIKKINLSNGFSTGPHDLIFMRENGKFCTGQVFDGYLRKWCNSINLKFVKSCHDIRRTYISNLFEIGLNPDTIRRLAGHENIEMTMKYCRSRMDKDEVLALIEKDF